jgi:hypothetical protein
MKLSNGAISVKENPVSHTAFLDFFKEHPAIAATIVYLQVSTVGIVYSWYLYWPFNINFFYYAKSSDFLLAAFREPVVFFQALITIFIIFVYLLWPSSYRVGKAFTIPIWAVRHYSIKRIFELLSEYLYLIVMVAVVFFLSFSLPAYQGQKTAEWIFNSAKAPEKVQMVDLEIKESGSNDKSSMRSLISIGTTEDYLFLYRPLDSTVHVFTISSVTSITTKKRLGYHPDSVLLYLDSLLSKSLSYFRHVETDHDN